MSRRLLSALLAACVLTSCGGSREDGPPRPAAPAPAPPSLSPAAPSRAPAVPRLTWQACGEGFECAGLAASGLPGGLAVTRLPAGRSDRRIGALVVNPGGPGAGAVDFLQQAWSTLPEELHERFDLVALDPRGVGRSSPVRCASTRELDAYYALDPVPDTAAELQALVGGARELGAGCARRSGPLLAQVSTAQAAEDLELLRRALGEPRLTYLGYSYGTAIGAAYLAAHPTRVRAMVLDGALDPALSWEELLAGQSAGFDAALEAFLADCARTPCGFRDALPSGADLGKAYDALVERVESEPLPGPDGRDVGPGELSLGVGGALYDRDTGWPALGQALADAHHGDGELLLGLSDGYLLRSNGAYDPLGEANTAVNCVDRPYPPDPQAYVALGRRLAARSPRFGEAIALAALPCATWPVPATGRPAPVRGAGSPPVVVLGTTGDPATPYAWAVSLAAQLDAGVLLTRVGEGHTAYRVDGPACLVRPVTDYLVDRRVPIAHRC